MEKGEKVEKVGKVEKVRSLDQSLIVVLLVLISILIGIIIAIPIVYSVGRVAGISTEDLYKDVPTTLSDNECTQPSKNTTILAYLNDSDAFPYTFKTVMYRPSVILKEVYLLFGFRHDYKSWALDNISVIDTTTTKNILNDGGFESNYLKLNYGICILSNTRRQYSDILFDNPYDGDFYYSDQTNVGMTYLSQKLSVTGGRYYNISFYLENRGALNNTFIALVGYG